MASYVAFSDLRASSAADSDCTPNVTLYSSELILIRLGLQGVISLFFADVKEKFSHFSIFLKYETSLDEPNNTGVKSSQIDSSDRVLIIISYEMPL